MKYIANHEDKFDYPVVGYILALLGLVQVFLYEFAIVFILFNQTSVGFTLGVYFSVASLTGMQ